MCRAHTLVPMRADNRSNLYARVFAPAAGVAEDPGSGSAAGPIGLFARQLWGTDECVVVGMGAEIRAGLLCSATRRHDPDARYIAALPFDSSCLNTASAVTISAVTTTRRHTPRGSASSRHFAPESPCGGGVTGWRGSLREHLVWAIA
jgi:hypothetical protein